MYSKGKASCKNKIDYDKVEQINTSSYKSKGGRASANK